MFAGRLEGALRAPVLADEVRLHVAGGLLASVVALDSQPPVDLLDVEVRQAELCLQRCDIGRKLAIINSIDFIGASFAVRQPLNET